MIIVSKGPDELSDNGSDSTQARVTRGRMQRDTVLVKRHPLYQKSLH